MKYIEEGPFFLAGSRSFIASGVIIVYMIASRHKIVFTRTSLASGAMLCACVICFVVANKMTTAANAVVLEYISPAFVLVFSALFLGQKLKKVETTVVALTFCGILMFFADELDIGNMAGNIIAIVSGAFMGGTFIINGRIKDMSEKMSGILLAHAFTAVIGFSVGSVTTEIDLSAVEIILMLILGVVQLGIPYVLYGKASSMISPLSCSLIGMIEPLLNPVWVAVFYGEIPGVFAMTGGIIVLGTVVFYNVWDEKSSGL